MKRYPIVFLILLLSLVAFGQELTQSQVERVDQLASQLISEKEVPGLAVSIAVGDQLVYSKGFGYADLEQMVPVDPAKTKFRIASISKTLTADALMHLVEAGKIDLDAEVQTYVPSFPKKRWPVTVRQVAGHIGGIRHYRGDEFLMSEHFDNVSQGLKIFEEDTLLFQPGEKYSYSSYGYNLISAVIEGASGMDYLTFMQSNVLSKLGLENTVPDLIYDIIPNRGRYYQMIDNKLINAYFVDNSYKWAGGGYLSTTEDLIKFALAHKQPGYLKASSLTELTTSQKTNDGKETNYGIGWFNRTDKNGNNYIGHSGGAIGGSSLFLIYPEHNITLAVTTNSSGISWGDFPYNVAWFLIE